MPQFLDYDPQTGVAHYFDYDEMTGEAAITYQQDLEPFLSHTKALANDGLTDRGIKKGWWLYAKVPAIVQVELHRKGIRLSDPTATQDILREINTNYPHLKCTQKNEGEKKKLIYDLGRKAEDVR